MTDATRLRATSCLILGRSAAKNPSPAPVPGWDTGYSLFEEQFEEQLDNEMYIWEFGNKNDDEYYQDDSKVYRLTQEERDGLEQYIRSCNTFMMVDTVVKNIAIEEAGKYFAGDCTAEDAAKAIQSRATLYLSEQS
ncbi:MAG: hypothetical protein K5695_15105 [Oscillospiraceae bacterium]|nr:hypothetical protein [Oscillospiraceae bacterium]